MPILSNKDIEKDKLQNALDLLSSYVDFSKILNAKRK